VSLENPSLTSRNFYDTYFQKSKIIEALVLLNLIEYIEDIDGIDATDFTFTNNNLNIKITQVDSSRIESDEIEYFRRYTRYLDIVSDSDEIILSIPLDLREDTNHIGFDELFDIANSSIADFYNSVDIKIIDVYNTISTGDYSDTLDSLKTLLETNLYAFLTSIFPNTNTDEKIYFGTANNKKLEDLLTIYFNDTVNLFYNKDLILDAYQNSNATTAEKNYANEYETTIAKDGQQIIFIDIKDLDISNYINKSYIEYNDDGTVDSEIDTYGKKIRDIFEISSTTILTGRFTYTILYKEVNPILREQSLSDSQEYIISRMINTSNPTKDTLFKSNNNGISFSSGADTYYRSYIEKDELFQINSDFYRYKFFYNNAYISRLSNESDIIGYYVEDNLNNNYGSKDYEKKEIELFLTIYQQTRDYYYRVLLNKSFIQENDYKLYEKLFISFFAIERFLNAKIENIHDPDYFNSTDIYNFLESYGLGVLNDEKYDFIIDGKDFKLNVIKLFNELVKLKGSRDVISVILRIFEIGDFEADIKKFLIYEDAEIGNSDFENKFEFKVTIDNIYKGITVTKSDDLPETGYAMLVELDDEKYLYELYKDGGKIDSDPPSNNDYFFDIKSKKFQRYNDAD
jgi:hypothetical protein